MKEYDEEEAKLVKSKEVAIKLLNERYVGARFQRDGRESLKELRKRLVAWRRPQVVGDVIVPPVDSPHTFVPPPITNDTIAEAPPVAAIAPPDVAIATVVDDPEAALTAPSVRWCLCRMKEQDYRKKFGNMVECTAVDCEFKWFPHKCIYEKETWDPPATWMCRPCSAKQNISRKRKL